MRAYRHAGPWLFPEGVAFPVVSAELHPLKIHSRGLLGRGILTAVVLHFVVFGAWLVQRQLGSDPLPLPDLPVPGDRVVVIEPPQPPPIDGDGRQPLEEAFSDPLVPDVTGIPVPTDDFLAPPVDYQAPEDWLNNRPSMDPNEIPGGNGSITFKFPSTSERDPGPEEFVPYEEPAYVIRNPAPVYPDMARAAEVEGLVVVRVLVNKEGLVEKAFVVSGHPMLDDAALQAVRHWAFRPATQQNRPVKVWVNVPVRFVLR